MEQIALESLKEIATRALSEARETERMVEQERNNEGKTERVPPFHTPLGVERGTQRTLARRERSGPGPMRLGEWRQWRGAKNDQ